MNLITRYITLSIAAAALAVACGGPLEEDEAGRAPVATDSASSELKIGGHTGGGSASYCEANAANCTGEGPVVAHPWDAPACTTICFGGAIARCLDEMCGSFGHKWPARCWCDAGGGGAGGAIH